MMKHLTLIVLLLLGSASWADDLWVRDLVRGRVTECVSDAPAPVQVIIEQVDTGEGPVDPGFQVSGEPIDANTDCATVDSYVNGQVVSGTLIEIRDGWKLSGVVYTAEISNGKTTYQLADFATIVPATKNGARYFATSNVLLGEDGKPTQYYIDYLRRQQKDVADVPASIMMIQREVGGATLLFTLDYRDEVNDD